MTSEAKARIDQSKQAIALLKKEIADLEKERDEAAKPITERWVALTEQMESVDVRPRKTDVLVDLVALAWAPQWVITGETPGGIQEVALPARR
jgi:hypothetical protein